MPARSIFAVAFLLIFTCAAPVVADDFFVIAHMINSLHAVDWALGQGANALEMDIRFDGSGMPTNFQHNDPNAIAAVCDCTCYCLGGCKGGSTHVCNTGLGGMATCSIATSVATQLQYLATKSGIALIVLDSKIDGSTPNIAAAGTNVINALVTNLFAKGYAGKVIVGAPKTDALPYLKTAVAAANASQYKSQIFFGFDGEFAQVTAPIKALASLATQNRVYGVGISACLSGTYLAEAGIVPAGRRRLWWLLVKLAFQPGPPSDAPTVPRKPFAWEPRL